MQALLSSELIRRHPKVALRPSPLYSPIGMPRLLDDGYSQHQIDQYDREYEVFVGKAATYFSRLHELIARSSAILEIEYLVENVSSVTANNLLIEFKGPTDAVVIADREDVRKWVPVSEPPTPPEAPKTVREQHWGISAALPRLSRLNEPRDPTGFFWQDRPEGKGERASLICAEFRARRSWPDSFFIYPMGPTPFEGRARVFGGATNLPAPVQAEATVRLTREPASWSDSDVLTRLDPWIAEHLASS